MAAPLLVAKNDKTALALLPALAKRLGLVTGTTGTGKGLTLQTLAQRFSSIGVPVFTADVKGDLAGLAKAGGANAKVDAEVGPRGGRQTQGMVEALAKSAASSGSALGRQVLRGILESVLGGSKRR